MKRPAPPWVSPRAVWVAGAAAVVSALCLIASCTPAKPPMPEAPGPTPPMPAITAAETGRFVGSKTCATCHADEAGKHAHSLHSQTIAPVETSDVIGKLRFDQRLLDRALGVTYSWRRDGDKLVCRVYRNSDGASEEMTPKYVVGSGRHGYTFLFERNGVYMESRLSYYPIAKRWAWTPGQEDQTPFRAPMGRRLDEGSTFACFLCHSTNLVHKEEQVLPEQSMFNVGCERCHGPGKEHVEQARAGAKPGKLWNYRGADGDTVMRLCGECHRQPGAVPDDELEHSPDLARFAGTALAASQCFRQSKGKLSCLSCHNPHATVSTDKAAYNRICMDCHTRKPKTQVAIAVAAKKLCPVNQKSGCVNCHMPAQHMPDPKEVQFHSHLIKPYPPEGKTVAQTH